VTTFKKFFVCILCIGLCYLLPLLFHPLNLGRLLSPMHVPVFICGLACGPGFGAVCAVLGPVICGALTGLPSTDVFPTMIPELVVYAVFAGLIMRKVHTRSLLLNVIFALVPSILLGRLTAVLAVGIYCALGVFGVDSFPVGELFSQYFTDAVTTISIHLVFVPLLVVTLKEEGLLKF